MRFGQYCILGCLDEKEGKTLKEVTKEVGQSIAWVSSSLSELEKSRLIIKTKGTKKGSRNKVYFTLAPEGIKIKEYLIKKASDLKLSYRDCLEYKNI